MSFLDDLYSPQVRSRPARLVLTPGQFKGGSEDDADHHLQQFENVSFCNGWDDGMKKLYFPHFLQGTANIWYFNWEKQNTFHKWSELKGAFSEAFQSIGSRSNAEARLRDRVQGLNETPEEYVYIFQCITIFINVCTYFSV